MITERDSIKGADVGFGKNVGKKNYIAEGFSLEWDNAGLRIRAIDYHSTQLMLDWDYVLKLAEATGGELAPKKCRGLRTNDVCGKLL